MRSSPRQKLGWGVANVMVLIIAAVPVLWLDLAVVQGSEHPHRRQLLSRRSGRTRTTAASSNSRSSPTRCVNSIGIAVIATVLGVAFGAMAAYAIARLDFGGKQLLIASALLIAMFPPIALVNPMFNLWREIGLFDTWPA